MKKMGGFILPLLILTLIYLIFHNWLSLNILSNGDWPYLYPQAVNEVTPFSAWDTLFNNGLGQSSMPKIWFDAYSLTIVKISNILTWPVFERLVWFFPYLLLSFGGSFLLSKRFLGDKNYRLLSSVIYSLNTYGLLVLSGGQVGIFIAYAFLPFAFSSLFYLLDKVNLKRSLIFSLATALIIMLDLRVGYTFLVAAFVLGVIYLIYNPGKIFNKALYLLIIPGVVSVGLHFFWILPILLMGRNPASQLADIYTSSTSLSFFSFAKIENTISLLHPNWPENIFGKVSFLRPEFIVIPILAFASLFFVSKEEGNKRMYLLSLVLVALLGTFLAKGTNDPAGLVYEFFFNKIPGFVMFRDPTKWYMLIALPFSILIPYLLLNLSKLIIKTKIKWKSVLICSIFILFWAFLIHDSFTGVLKGTLVTRQVPDNYKKLADLVESQKNFSRTLWIPTYPTFAYESNTHPAIPGVEFFVATSNANLINILKKPETEDLLQQSSIKYVVVPEDTDKRIFLSDRKYSEEMYQKAFDGVKSISYLKPVGNFGRIGVFEVMSPKGHFWGIGKNIKTSSKYILPTKYSVHVKNAEKGDVLVFTDIYDKFWEAAVGDQKSTSRVFKISRTVSYNSFILPKAGSYDLTVTYLPQEWLNLGLIISFIALLIVLTVLFKVRRDK